MQAIKPGWVEQVARSDPDDWRYPFYLHLAPSGDWRTAGAGGRLLAAGREPDSAPPGEAKHPAGDEEDQLLARLQTADDEN